VSAPLLVAIAVTSFCAIALLVLWLAGRPSKEAKRVLRVVQPDLPEKDTNTSREAVLEQALGLVRLLRTKLTIFDNQKTRQFLIAAGCTRPGDLDLYFGYRILAPIAGIIIGTYIPGNTVSWALVLVGFTYLLPDFVLKRIVKRRREKIRLGMPDAIDLLVICVEAGLGLDQALLRSGQELAISHPEISEEFSQINLEQRAGKTRIDAWRSMADRTKLDVARSFTNMLAQTDRFGTPIARALGNFSDNLRLKRRQRAEEVAAKTTVKLIFPLVLFIFPSIFIVLLGPAMISMTQSLGGLFK